MPSETACNPRDCRAGADAQSGAPPPRWDRTSPVGPAIAESVAKFFSDATNRSVLERLAAAGVSMVESRRPTTRNRRLAGRSFVLTGALRGLTRDDATAALERRGARVTSTVSRSTDCVIVGDKQGAKLAIARRLGVPTQGQREFLALVGAEPPRRRAHPAPTPTRAGRTQPRPRAAGTQQRPLAAQPWVPPRRGSLRSLSWLLVRSATGRRVSPTPRGPVHALPRQPRHRGHFRLRTDIGIRDAFTGRLPRHSGVRAPGRDVPPRFLGKRHGQPEPTVAVRHCPARESQRVA